MKIAIISDIHDNLTRWQEVADITKREKISTAICCGDVTSLDTLEEIAKVFKKVYLALGNGDYKIKNLPDLAPENVEIFGQIGMVNLESQKIAFCHYNWLADKLAENGKYDLVFYGHTHTPWQKKVRETLILNPGEIAGQFGHASFAIFDLKAMKAELKILK